MAVENRDQFYGNLPIWEVSVLDLLADTQQFTAVPEDWHVVITDIKRSTEAVTRGAHQIVNLVATGSIIAGLNIARDQGIDIPFFFGGDGGTLIVPACILTPLMQALREHQQNTADNFGLELRVGHLPVGRMYEQQLDLNIARIRLNDMLSIPVILGDGLQFAEEIIKSCTDPTQASTRPDTSSSLNLEGMECRWNRIQPPDHSEEVVSLLVVGKGNTQQAQVFRRVLAAIESIYGPPPRREPISVSKLHLRATIGKVKTEMRARLGRFDLVYLIRNWLITWASKRYFQLSKSGKAHLRQLVQLTDTLVLDGRINTVISGTAGQRKELQTALESLEEEGLLSFGLHVSQASIMSCYVRDHQNLHIHFVDGADGGYSMAAKVLKAKLRAERTNHTDPF